MKLSDFIQQLQECYEENGDMEVAVCVDGAIRHIVGMNAVDDTIYIEGYMDY